MEPNKGEMIREAKENGGIPCGKESSFSAGFVAEPSVGLLILHYDKLIKVGCKMHRTGRCVARALNNKGVELAKEINAAHRKEGLVVLADF